MDKNSPIRSGKVTGAAWLALLALDHPGQHDYDYLRTIYEDAPKVGLDPGLIAAQWSEETNKGTAIRWNNDFNPAGIGIPADSTPQPFRIANGVEAAHVHLSAMNLLVAGFRAEPWHNTNEQEKWINDVWIGHVNSGPVVHVLSELSLHFKCGNDQCATWAWDEAYADNILEHYAFLFAGQNDLPLTIRQNLAPTSNRNIPDAPLNAGSATVTIHENGNPGANAAGEVQFVWDGGGDALASFHFAVDTREAVQAIKLSKNAYHAADNCDDRAADIGCFASAAIETVETAQRSGPDWEHTLRNLVRLVGAIKSCDSRIDYGDKPCSDYKNTRVNKHYDWNAGDPNRHICPSWILADGRWDQVVWAILLFIDRPVAPTPPPPPPAPLYPKPVPVVPFLKGGLDHTRSDGALFRAIKRKVTLVEPFAPRKTASMQAPVTGKEYKKGAQVWIYGIVEGGGRTWAITSDSSRLPVSVLKEHWLEGMARE